jgi:molybdopterin-synthase adenylyltransferase
MRDMGAALPCATRDRGNPCDYPLARPFALALTMFAALTITDFFRCSFCHEFEMIWHDLTIHYGF